MPNYVLDKIYQVVEPGGVKACRVVIYGKTDGSVEYLKEKWEKNIAGITIHSKKEGECVTVRKLGIATCETAGPVKAGEAVYPADEEGRIVGEQDKRKCFWQVGIAEESADAAGYKVEVFLTL